MWATPVNEAVIDLVAPCATELVVDVGAGMGPTTVLAARRGADVVAVDPTPFMRHVLRVRRLAQRERQCIEIVDGAAESMPVDDAAAHAAWSVNAMHHFTDPDGAAAELHRVLRSGGRLVLVDEDFDDPRHELYEEMKDRHGGHDHDHGGSDHDSSDHDSSDHDGHEDGHDHGGSDHEMHMVDIEAMAETLRRAGFVCVDAALEDLGGQPVRRLTARKP